jgi:endonuclease YncB( thermonuclease family)
LNLANDIEMEITMKVCQGIIVAVLGVAVFAYKGCQQKADPIDSVDARSLKQVEFIKQKSCEVIRVSDGDTIVVRCEGEELKIRFCGIDGPEKSQPLGRS